MKSDKALFKLVLIICIAGMLASCILPKTEYEPFKIQYRFYGGIAAGVHSQININENGDLIYKNYSYSIKTKLENETLSDLFNDLNSNSFLGLNHVYDDHVCCDGSYGEITYVSESDSHRVTVAHCTMENSKGGWKDRFNNIVHSIHACIDSNDLNIDTAHVSVHNPISIFQWPYSSTYRLADHIGNNNVVRQSILAHVQDKEANSESEYFALFHEDGYLYHVNSPGDTAINIYNQTTGTEWPFTPGLSDIDESGLILTGNDVFWLKDTLAVLNYPEFFYDSKTEAGAKVYSIHLKQGNYFTNTLY